MAEGISHLLVRGCVLCIRAVAAKLASIAWLRFLAHRICFQPLLLQLVGRSLAAAASFSWFESATQEYWTKVRVLFLNLVLAHVPLKRLDPKVFVEELVSLASKVGLARGISNTRLAVRAEGAAERVEMDDESNSRIQKIATFGESVDGDVGDAEGGEGLEDRNMDSAETSTAENFSVGRLSQGAFFEKKMAKLLVSTSASRHFCREIADKGGVEILMQLMQSKFEKVRMSACVVLGRAAMYCSAESSIEVVHLLISLVRENSVEVCSELHSEATSLKEVAVFALGRLGRKGRRLSDLIGESGVLLDLLDILSGANGRMQRVVLTAMKELVVLSAGNQTLLANAGCLELVLHLLRSTEPIVKQCAAEILAAIAWIAEVRRAIVELAGIPMLVEAARVGHMVSRTRAAHALGLLAFRKRFRRIIADADAIPVLVDLLRDGDMAAKLVAGNALGILSAHVDHLRPVAQAGAIPLFVDLLEVDDPLGKEIAEDAFCILAVSEENAIAIADHLVRVLQTASISAKAAAADIVWDLCSYKHSTPVVRASGAIPLLVSLLQEANEEARERATGALAQLSYDESDRQAMCDAGAIPLLVCCLGDESEEVKENAAEALQNFVEDSSFENELSATDCIPSLMEICNHRGASGSGETGDHAAATLTHVSLTHFM